MNYLALWAGKWFACGMREDSCRDRSHLEEVLYHLVVELSLNREFRKLEFDWIRSQSDLVTKKDLKETETKIMSKISDFAARQATHNAKVDAAVSGIEGDVKLLTDLVEKLQGTQGDVTPEDQLLLDEIERQSDVVAHRVEALDAMTAPVIPPVVPDPEPPVVEPPPPAPVDPQARRR